MEELCYMCIHCNTDKSKLPCFGCYDKPNKPNIEPKKSYENPYWERITQIANIQREKGISTYGQGLEDNILPDVLKRIEYIQEELIDGLMYLEWLKDKLKEGEK